MPNTLVIIHAATHLPRFDFCFYLSVFMIGVRPVDDSDKRDERSEFDLF